jgi:prephenate dehydratase
VQTVTYPGRPGAHSAAAAAKLFPDAELVPAPTFRAVAESVAGASAAFGVLPIESSLAGSVAETHDLLHRSPLSIVGEAVLPIRHVLAAKEPIPLGQLRAIRSHPSAFDQCRGLLARLPRAATIAAATTADAAQQVAEAGGFPEAAIASPEAATLYGLTVLADDVGDGPASTRFVSVAPFTRLDGAGGDTRTAFSFVTDHRPGALHHAIAPLARAGLDLVQLVSRPLPDSDWRYRFDAVLAGHALDPAVRVALAAMREETRALRVLGVYEAASASASES